MGDAKSEPLVESRLPKRRRWMFRLVAVGCGLLLALGVTELVLRLTYEPQRLRSMRMLRNNEKPNEFYYCYDTNPNGEFQDLPDMSQGYWSLVENQSPQNNWPQDRYMAKDAEETPYCVHVELAQVGDAPYRDWHYEREIPPGKTRIVLAGDSFVFGQGVPIENTMSRELNSELGQGYQVVNAGLIGLDTHRELERLKNLRQEIDFQAAVVVFIPNDIELTAELAQQQAYINDFINIREGVWRRRGRWYSGHLALFELVGSYLDMRSIENETRQWYLDMYDPAKNQKILDKLGEDIKQLGRQPYPVAFVIFPLVESLEDYPFDSIHQQVAKMAREAGLPVLDVLPQLAKHPTVELQVHPSDHHPNGKALAIAAEAIAVWLKTSQPQILKPPVVVTNETTAQP